MSDIVFSAKKRKQELKKLGAYHTKRALALMVKERLEALAGDSKIQKVMDICCGSGNLLSVFDDDVDKVGVDIEPEFVNYCKENLKGEFLERNALLLRGEYSPYIVGNYPFGLRDKEVAKEAWEFMRDVTNQKALFDPNNTPNHRLIRALEIKLKEWKKLYLSQKPKENNTPSLFD